MNTRQTTTIAALIALVLLLPAGRLGAEISEPDHILYGTPSLYGVPATAGTLTLTVGDDPEVIAAYEIGSEPDLGAFFALRVSLDAVGQRNPGTARTGDVAKVFLDGELAAFTTIGERGTAQLLTADPELVDSAALTIGDAEVLEGDSGTVEIQFTISLSLTSDDDVEVRWETRSGLGPDGARSGEDFHGATGLATIPAGDLSAGITVEVFGDAEIETDEEFFVDLSDPLNAVLLDPEGKGTILDDDTPPELLIDNVTVAEPTAGESVTAIFTVRISHPWDQDVDFDFFAEEVPGGATGGSDYLLNPGTGTIPAGDLSTTIVVEVLGDGEAEGEETFLVRLANPVNAGILDGEGQGTIVDFARFLVWVEAQANGAAGVDGLAGAFAVAVSPDDRHVYAAGRAQDSLVVFARDSLSGALSFTQRYVDGVDGIDGLAGIEAVLVSHDGSQVFAAGFDEDAVAVFERDPASGALTLLEVERDGAIDNETGRTIEGLAGATALAEAVDETGQPHHLYVAGHDDGAVAVFAVAVDGKLRYQMAMVDGDGEVDGLHQVSDLVVSPDGGHLYAAGFGDNAVAVFDRNAEDGFLSFLEQQRSGLAGVTGLGGAVALALPADGAYLYAAGQLDSGIAVFARSTDAGSPDFGRLSFRQAVLDADAGFDGLAAASDVGLSRDPTKGDYLYATGLSADAVVVFDRGADGTLSHLETRRDDAGGIDGLAGANALAVSGADLNVYVAGSLESSVAVFGRDLVPPGAPLTLTSTSHTPGVPSNDPNLDFLWAGAHDAGLGVGEYHVLLDTAPDTEPPFGAGALTLAHGEDPQEVAIAAPADHDGYYFHLRTCDVARNCTAITEHLGPFHVDATAPQPPSAVVTTSHGVPSPDPVVAMTWAPPPDAGPGDFPSALTGYAYSFTQSSVPECDGELDLTDVATAGVLSPPLPAGDWYFHICTGDEAGNFSVPVTVGPLVVDVDDSPPLVLRVETVAASAGGELLEGEWSAAAITQLVAVFSEVLDDAGGGTTATDVTNPLNYRLLAAGPDGWFDTTQCGGGLLGDDREAAIDVVLYDALSGRAALLLNGGNSLALGRYRLLVCGGLRDLNANPLDGDGDGVAGGDFRRHFSVTRQNLLRNPNFDREIDGWGLSAEPPVSLGAGDGEAATTSGSLAMLRRTGDELTYVLVQCVDLATGDLGALYALSGLVRLTEVNGLESRSQARVELHDVPSCGNPIAGATVISDPVIGNATGVWQELTLEVVDAAGAVSAEISYSVEIPDNFDFDAHFDRLLFGAADQRPPSPPAVASTSHQAGVWSNDPTIDVEWQGATDGGVGVAEYRIAFDQSPGTVPDAGSMPHVVDPHTRTSDPLADGGNFVHLRACDDAGNCSPTDHLGPFPIDTVAPGSPGDLALAVSGDNVLELSWSAPADPALASGIDGYGYAVDESADWACDFVKRLEEDAVSLSVPVPSGDWYVHLCAVDAAGNWGPVANLGPLAVNDANPPRVTRINTVAGAADGELDDDEKTMTAITQLLVGFSEAMSDPSGDGATDDVTNPANYRLLAPGANATLDTGSCAGGGNDDESVAIEGVLYDSTSSVAALRISGGESLPGGHYRLLVCGSASLADLSGNALGGGVDKLFNFEVVAANLLVNPNFDEDLTAWTSSDPGLCAFGSDDADGAVTSGSAEVTVLEEGVGFGQCVELQDERLVRLVGRVRIEQIGSAAAAAAGELTWFSQPGCGGAELGTASSAPVVGSTGEGWLDLDLEVRGPAAAASALVSFLVVPDGGPDGAAVLSFDNTAFQVRFAIFVDGFESGDTSAWSSAVP